MIDPQKTPKSSASKKKIRVEDGASELMGLFAPPLNNNNDTNDGNHEDGGSHPLSPPPPPPPTSPPSLQTPPPMTLNIHAERTTSIDRSEASEPDESVFYDALHQLTPTTEGNQNPWNEKEEKDAFDCFDDEGGSPRRRTTEVHSHSSRRNNNHNDHFLQPPEQNQIISPTNSSSSPTRGGESQLLENLFINPADETKQAHSIISSNNSPSRPTDRTPLLLQQQQRQDDTAELQQEEASFFSFQPTFHTLTSTIPVSEFPSHTTAAASAAHISSSRAKQKMRRIDEIPGPNQNSRWFQYALNWSQHFCSSAKAFALEFAQPWTWLGGFMFLLYHTVFCLTMGSAVTRPNGFPNMLGLFTKMSAGGIIFGSPILWILLGDIPSLYPSVDLFSAPFFADIALKVDATLAADPSIQSLTSEEGNQVFLASFAFLAQLSMVITGVFVVLASVFKLANVGSFLPYSVLAGFFAAVAVLTWQLAFKIDSNGASVGAVLTSGDWSLIADSVIHHAPSVVTALLMHRLGPKHPFYVIGLVIASVSIFYVIMFMFGVSREKAMEGNWFWGVGDLVYGPLNAPFGFRDWVIPAPFGWVKSYFIKKSIHWGAVMSGMDTAIALAFLYLIRSSLHAPALRKNVTNLVRPELIESNNVETNNGNRHTSISESSNFTMGNRTFSEVIDVENTRGKDDATSSTFAMVPAKPTSLSVKEIMASYGYSTFVCALFGFLFITPNISISVTMYKLRAEKVAPQFVACMLLLIFYLFDFRVVGYIPKTAFSSLLVLAFINNVDTYVLKSYYRTKEKLEWLVVPLIVGLAFLVGLLEAVFLGIAISTFIFVASFFRSGVVKFIATGTVIRSTIERPPQSALWLDENGALIQVLVLQNYLFFGNSSSIMNYISSMFDEPEEVIDDWLLPPLPRIVIMDLTLVSGIDTSAVDIFSEILVKCGSHDCKLFISGASTSLRKAMQLGGFTANTSAALSKRKLRFFPDLDSAVGKAEDMLLTEASFEDQIHYGLSTSSGFLRALEHIDRQHQLCYSNSLAALEPYMTRFSLEPGQVLYDEIDVPRGLFFIEHGVLKVEQNAHDTVTRTGSKLTLGGSAQMHSLNVLKARSIPVTHQAPGTGVLERRDFRVARIGPGWVLGTGESLTGVGNPGKYIAVSQSVVHYISFEKVEELEESEPRLILDLHKLLAYLMAKRQSVTINQLATLHSIMSSPALKRPMSRSKLGIFSGTIR
ncbi:hypothetical protein ACA910_001722 [Epithemia clementina (nom. ined.)]